MNLPSSLALSQSKLFQSRLGILLLALVGIAIAAGLFLMNQDRARRLVTPTPATSPAAQAPPRSIPAAKQLVFHGPPAPSWAKPAVPFGPPVPPELALSEGPAREAAPAVPAPLAQPVAPNVAAPAVPASAVPVAAVSSPVANAPAPAIPAGSIAASEIPKSVDASVLFTRERYDYVSGGRRDPFQSLIDGRYQGQSGDASLIDVGDIHLVGIMWGSSDKFALVEDSRGHGYVLRVGDPVVNGYISGITKSELQVVQSAFGESQSLSITMQTKEGDKNATRN